MQMLFQAFVAKDRKIGLDIIPTKTSLELTDLVVVGHLHKSAYQFCLHLLFDYKNWWSPFDKVSLLLDLRLVHSMPWVQ